MFAVLTTIYSCLNLPIYLHTLYISMAYPGTIQASQKIDSNRLKTTTFVKVVLTSTKHNIYLIMTTKHIPNMHPSME